MTGLDANGSATTPDNTYTYARFGATASANETVSNPFRFAGYYLDSGTGLYHVGQRYYDPASGAAPWEQRDPISNPSNPTSWDRYVYSGDDPINFTDPTGRVCLASLAFGAGIFGAVSLPVELFVVLSAVTGGEADAAAAAYGSEALPFVLRWILPGYALGIGMMASGAASNC